MKLVIRGEVEKHIDWFMGNNLSSFCLRCNIGCSEVIQYICLCCRISNHKICSKLKVRKLVKEKINSRLFCGSCRIKDYIL